MAYNISLWKTKRLENFSIPLEAFYTSDRQDWHPSRPEITSPDACEIVLECGCEQTIRGILQSGQLTINQFEMAGEGSGVFYNAILLPALQRSHGRLEAVLIWEGGDSIIRLTVEDGLLFEEDIEL